MFQPPALTFLCEIRIDAGEAGFRLGRTPLGLRRIGAIRSGLVEGPRLSGRLFPGGGDWALVAADGAIHIDMRCMIETGDGEGVYVRQQGRIAAPEGDARDAVMDRARWGELDPASYYFRTTALFEAAAPQWDWLNRVAAVGAGRHIEGGVAYRLFTLD